MEGLRLNRPQSSTVDVESLKANTSDEGMRTQLWKHDSREDNFGGRNGEFRNDKLSLWDDCIVVFTSNDVDVEGIVTKASTRRWTHRLAVTVSVLTADALGFADRLIRAQKILFSDPVQKDETTINSVGTCRILTVFYVYANSLLRKYYDNEINSILSLPCFQRRFPGSTSKSSDRSTPTDCYQLQL